MKALARLLWAGVAAVALAPMADAADWQIDEWRVIPLQNQIGPDRALAVRAAPGIMIAFQCDTTLLIGINAKDTFMRATLDGMRARQDWHWARLESATDDRSFPGRALLTAWDTSKPWAEISMRVADPAYRDLLWEGGRMRLILGTIVAEFSTTGAAAGLMGLPVDCPLAEVQGRQRF